MSQSQIREPNSFGKRKELHSIIITRNGNSRQYSVNPLHFSMLACFIAMFSVGYIAATTYLVLRDNLISSRTARNARLQHEYEDRIAALRSNLDRITSRQLLDQQAIEAKVSQLIERQNRLQDHNPVMKSVITKASALGLDTSKLPEFETIANPTQIQEKVEKQTFLLPKFGNLFSLRGLGDKQNLALDAKLSQQQKSASSYHIPVNLQADGAFKYGINSPVLAQVSRSMQSVDEGQKYVIATLRNSANNKLVEFAKLMKRVGVKIPAPALHPTMSQIGGPFEPLDQSSDFSAHLNALENTLSALKKARAKIGLVPVAYPVPGKSISSKFGSRLDPFRGTYAMHSGLDFRAISGSPVKATANGEVIFAGTNGGYGKLVEIKHANGLVTRYAHLKKILVYKGQNIEAGEQIGTVGSTGRSTGPHLHYEIRHHDTAVNPKKYLNIGRKLTRLL